MDSDRAKRSGTKMKKRADAWSSLQQAASVNEVRDPMRWYDRRHQQADVTHERVQREALRASELATEYIGGSHGSRANC